MKLYNTLTKSIVAVKPLRDNELRIYSCGPTVYDHIHIGNLSSFIFADGQEIDPKPIGVSCNVIGLSLPDIESQRFIESSRLIEVFYRKGQS